MVLLLVLAVAVAEPRADPTTRLVEQACRSQGIEALLGASDASPLTSTHRLRQLYEDPRLEFALRDLEDELDALDGGEHWSWRVRPTGALVLGTRTPDYRSGDDEAGGISARSSLDSRLYRPWKGQVFELAVTPEIRADVGPDPTPELGALPRELWGGLHGPSWTVGGGLRDRWLGPGRHGGLILTDNASPAPLFGAAWEGHLAPPIRPDIHWGTIRLEAGAGWMTGDRDDVERPGWLLMDLRWAPVPRIELGASRMGLFGGVDRPTPSLGQLLLPTDPHVYDDPDQEEPDQDEIAALDIRVNLPLVAWGLPLDYLELWWQYGGEDVIARELLGVPVPSLAGVANLGGMELVRTPWTLTVEGARVLDDYFRWYTGHRVYHEGFTRNGHAMGMGPGGDSLTAWGALAWFPGERGAEIWVERIHRVAVAEALGDNLLALATDEWRDSVGLRGWQFRESVGWWRLGLSIERSRGLDFVPGSDAWAWRISLEG
ncbi:MAG: capsule assembly Wzi family protein [Myxococcota bacterium]|nr:capsule assembly Wzi family protein [Myxococcota bacterium]